MKEVRNHGFRSLFGYFFGSKKVSRRRNSVQAETDNYNKKMTIRKYTESKSIQNEIFAMPFTSINIYTLKQIRTKRHHYDLEGFQITSPLVCYNVLQYLLDLKSEPVEKLGIIALNTKHKIVGIHIIGTGTIDKVYIEPR